MISRFKWIAPVAALAALGACSFSYDSSGPSSSETRTFSDFDSIDASAGVNVVLKQGAYNVSVSGPKDKLSGIKVVQDGKKLKVFREGFNSWFSWGGHYEATITAPTFVSVSASSGADVDGSDLALEAVELDASSGGDIELTGTCKAVRAEAGSGGDVDGEALKCEDAEAQASSGGDVDLFASASANGQASSGGDVTFHGKPAKFTKQESSGGDVDTD
jgi:Putative auto-transporter adhesin, head GIN domain